VEAPRIAVGEVRRFLSATPLPKKVFLVAFDEKMRMILMSALDGMETP
jgi:hypothetical protein